MARPREFDEAVVLNRARDLLLANGVNATSINELSSAMGLSVGSIYKAFGSKDALITRVLDDYLVASRADMAAELEAGATGREGLERLLDLITRSVADAPTTPADTGATPGCFAVNCSIERAATDAAIAEKLRRHDEAVLALIEAGIERVAADEDRDLDAATGAALLYTTINGLQVAARKGVRSDDADKILGLALTAAIGG